MSDLAKTSAFQKALEAVEALSIEDKQIFLDIVQKRLRDQKRTQLNQEIAQVRQEYSEGNVTFGSVSDFLAALDEE